MKARILIEDDDYDISVDAMQHRKRNTLPGGVDHSVRYALAASLQDLYHYCLAILPSLAPGEETAFADTYRSLRGKLIAYESLRDGLSKWATPEIPAFADPYWPRVEEVDTLEQLNSLVKRVFIAICQVAKDNAIDPYSGEAIRSEHPFDSDL